MVISLTFQGKKRTGLLKISGTGFVDKYQESLSALYLDSVTRKLFDKGFKAPTEKIFEGIPFNKSVSTALYTPIFSAPKGYFSGSSLATYDSIKGHYPPLSIGEVASEWNDNLKDNLEYIRDQVTEGFSYLWAVQGVRNTSMEHPRDETNIAVMPTEKFVVQVINNLQSL